MNAVSKMMPNVPTLPAASSMVKRTMLVSSMRLGTAYSPMPLNAMMMIAGVETNPAFTAVSPSTSAPTTESAMPTYLGMRMLASLSTSKTSSTSSISSDGESGMSRMLPAMVSKSLTGSSCSLKSCALT